MPEKAIQWQRDFLKIDDERRIVTGIVVEPMVRDTYDDWMVSEEIERAAFGFMEESQRLKVMHSQAAQQCHLVESWVTKEDGAINDTYISKGTWMVSVHVVDDEIWKDIKEGRLNGFSFGGKGFGVPEGAN